MASDRRTNRILSSSNGIQSNDENVPNHLKLTQKLASTRNLQSNNKGILINANQ